MGNQKAQILLSEGEEKKVSSVDLLDVLGKEVRMKL